MGPVVAGPVGPVTTGAGLVGGLGLDGPLGPEPAWPDVLAGPVGPVAGVGGSSETYPSQSGAFSEASALFEKRTMRTSRFWPVIFFRFNFPLNLPSLSHREMISRLFQSVLGVSAIIFIYLFTVYTVRRIYLNRLILSLSYLGFPSVGK